MEDMFQKLKAKKQNSVDNLTKLIKDAKIVEQGKATEDEIKKKFNDVSDQSNVEFKKFKSVVNQLAKENKVTMDDVSKKLTEAGSQFSSAASSAVEAGVNSLKAVFGVK